MQEKLVPIGIVAHRVNAEILGKFFLDSGSFEIAPLESVLSGMKLNSVKENPYEDSLNVLRELYETVGKKPKPNVEAVSLPMVIDEQEVEEFTRSLKERFDELEKERRELEESLRELESCIESLELVVDVDVPLVEISSMRYVVFKMGWFHPTHYTRFVSSLSDVDVLVVELRRSDDRVYTILMYPRGLEERMEDVLKSASFNPMRLPSVEETPREALFEYKDRRKAVQIKIEELELKKRELFYENRRKIYEYYDEIFVLKSVHDFLSGSETTEEFVLMMGWITEGSLRDLRELEERLGSFMVFENVEIPLKRPTLLKNPRFFKHFESLVEMYGIPRSDEIDPTPLTSILFLFFYGFMFGDVGHGLVIASLAWLLFRRTLNDIWYIMTFAGLSSTLFGFLYGSLFGFECLPPLFERPMENVNDFLIVSIAIGIFLITLGMVLNVFNRIRRREYKELIFDPNGLAGIGLYLTVVSNVWSYIVNGELLVPPLALIAIVVLFVALIFLHTVLFEEGTLGERMILAFFDTLDRLIGYFSNTLSFIRLGAFALNHAGLFLAFYTMAEMSSSPLGSFLSLLIGNLLLIFLEGMVVFIQSVRLEFYEFYSKFYSGDGRPFNPATYWNEGGAEK